MSKKESAVAGVGCCAQGCKKDVWKFSFCNEHYDHFKFGLIKKSGVPVSDYEKKLSHYLAHKGGKQKSA